jgi:hypothetical protein
VSEATRESPAYRGVYRRAALYADPLADAGYFQCFRLLWCRGVGGVGDVGCTASELKDECALRLSCNLAS